jgi:hypothetical protein
MSKKTEMVLAVASVPDAITAINKKLAELKHITDSVYKTKKSFDGFNLETETKVENLVKMLSSIRAREKAYNDAQSELATSFNGSFTAAPFKVEGSTGDEWAYDIVLRIKIIQQKDTHDKLVGMKKKWEELMDKEDRKNLLLKEMNDFLGNVEGEFEEVTAE